MRLFCSTHFLTLKIFNLCSPSTTDDVIFDNLPAKDLLRYAQVCHSAHDAVSSYLRRAFKLERLLSRYLSDKEILELRCLQFSTGAIISGSTALQFLDRSFYPDSDLDIYVQQDYTQEIASWLETIGYKMLPREGSTKTNLQHTMAEMAELSDVPMIPPSSNIYPGSFAILEFSRGYSENRVQLMITEGSPVASVLHFHSSMFKLFDSFYLLTPALACVMNFITYEKAYALYPGATFSARKSLVTSVISRPSHAHQHSTDRALEKYKARGWQIIRRMTKELITEDSANFPTGLRRVGDSKCWTMTILPKLDFPPSTIEANTWKLDHDRFLGSAMKFATFSEPQLRFNYTEASFYTSDSCR